MKPPYKPIREGVASFLNSLLLRHEQSIRYYNDFASVSNKSETVSDFYKELTKYRSSMKQDIEEQIRNSPPTAHTPSRESKSFLSDEVNRINRAILSGNVFDLTSLVFENEKKLNEYLTLILSSGQLSDDSRALFQKHIEQNRQAMIRADRVKTVEI
ncbi:MAG: hypothetical protein AAF741_15505 [Bacteroidota bacterium]